MLVGKLQDELRAHVSEESRDVDYPSAGIT